jgi:hypothetical protein
MKQKAKGKVKNPKPELAIDHLIGNLPPWKGRGVVVLEGGNEKKTYHPRKGWIKGR